MHIPWEKRLLFAETSAVQISENFWVNMQFFVQGTSLRKSCVMGGTYSLGLHKYGMKFVSVPS